MHIMRRQPRSTRAATADRDGSSDPNSAVPPERREPTLDLEAVEHTVAAVRLLARDMRMGMVPSS